MILPYSLYYEHNKSPRGRSRLFVPQAFSISSFTEHFQRCLLHRLSSLMDLIITSTPGAGGREGNPQAKSRESNPEEYQ